MELWDIYDENKQPTGRTMRRGISSDSTWRSCTTGWNIFDHKTCHDQGVGTGLLGGFRRSSTGR